jgi:hypothetical protein
MVFLIKIVIVINSHLHLQLRHPGLWGADGQPHVEANMESKQQLEQQAEKIKRLEA